MNPLEIPLALSDVTGEWVEAALALRYPGTRIAAFEADGPFGFKPNKLRLRMAYAPGGNPGDLPERMVVKGGFPGNGNYGSGLDYGMQLEVLTHRDVVELFGIHTCKNYYIGYDEAAGQGVLLLEDLAVKNAKFFNVFTPMSLAEATAFADAMAGFHARSWNSPEFAEGGRVGPQTPLGRIRKILFKTYFDRLMIDAHFYAHHIELPRGAVLPKMLRDPELMTAGMAALKALTKLQPRCFIHGDEHLGNVFMAEDGTPGFIDFAGRPDAWNLGFTYFMIHSVDPLDRRRWERFLLTRYLDGLRAAGIAAPSFEDAWYVYRVTSIFLLCLWINNSPRWQPEAINGANCLRAAFAVLDHDAFGLLGCR